MDTITKRLKNLSSLVGNTPLLEISFTYRGHVRVLYAKAEYFNVSGSIKDRIALHIIKKGYETGKLKPGNMIAEATKVIRTDDGDAILMAQKLARMRLGVGISSGANFIGALIAQEKLGGKGIVATIFSDDNKKYLSTDLMKEEPVKHGYYSTDIELLSIQAIKRACIICCEPEDCYEAGVTDTVCCPKKNATRTEEVQ